MAARKRKMAPRKALGVVRRKPEQLDLNIDPLAMAKATVEKINNIRAQIKPLKRTEEELSTEIKLWGIGVYAGFTTAIQVFDQPGEGFDMDKFKAENPELYAKYKTDKPKRTAKTVPLVKG